MARYGRTLRVLSDQTRDALLPLPLAALRIAPETVAALAQVGLKRIADVIDRPRAPLAARFGEQFVRRIDQAIGRDDEPITPRLPVPAYVTERRFAEPIAREDDVLGTIEHLAHELVRLLERRGEGARLIEAALFRTDGKVHRIAAGTGAPLRDPARIRALFVERLAAIGDECDPGFGYDVIRLGALATERCDPAQTGLAGPDHAAELAHLIDRLGARFGLRRVTRLVPQDTHIPEYAVDGGGGGALSRATGSIASRVQPASSAGGSGSRPLRCYDQDSLAPIRPIRLFERPELIEAIAEVPDGPPVQFTWRRVRYVVAHVEGPERIAMEWWRDEPGPRAHARLFPGRKPRGPARLALPRRRSSTDPRRRAGSCTGCSHEQRPSVFRSRQAAACRNHGCIRARLCRTRRHHQFLLPARRLASGRTGRARHRAGLAGIGIADRNSVAGVVRAHTAAQEEDADGNKRIKLKIAPGARLVFADGTPDILAYPQDRAAWGRLTRLLTVGKSRGEKAECILYLDDLLEHIEGLNLIVMPADAIDAAATTAPARALEDSGRFAIGLACGRHALSRRRPPPAGAADRDCRRCRACR